ncbi:MAG: tellurite resistance TerB family protein [Planctomycetaceae bacterium]|nr:tellurite resistance TerB family protein [Planctomycetaceae bacterium]
MSLFDDILEDGNTFQEQPYGPHEGYAGVLLCASACDGHIADDEGQALFMILRQKKLYQRLSEQQFGSLVDRLLGQLRRGGPEKLLEKCYPVVPTELRESVFANAVDIVLSDGTVEEAERDFIDGLKAKLDIDEQRAKTIVKVMVYKNHG